LALFPYKYFADFVRYAATIVSSSAINVTLDIVMPRIRISEQTMKYTLFALLLCSLLIGTAHADIANYTIISSDNSLRDEGEDNIEQYLAQLDIKPTDGDDFIRQQVIKQTTQALQAIGYYQSLSTVTISPRKGELNIRVDVSMGYATLMAQSDFSVVGEGRNDSDFIALRATFPIVLGSKFHHGNFETNKTYFDQLAQTKGYFDARWTISEVTVDLVTNRAHLIQTFDTGSRYRFGNTIIPTKHQATELIKAMIPFSMGDFYHSDQLAKFNFALNKSQYFASAQAIPTKPDASNSIVDIELSLIDKPRNIVELSLGYNTDNHERASIVWTKPWINRYGHNLVSKANFSRQDKSISTDYRIPHGDPNNDYTSVLLGWQDINTSGQDYEKYSLQWQRHQPVDSNWQRTLFLKVEREYNRIDNIVSNLVIPGISYSRTRSRGGVATYWGDRQLYSLEAANKGWGSSSDLIKLSVHSNWLRQYNESHQFLLKMQLGAIHASSIDDVPNSLRFYSGGDDNLRAYDFKSVSPLQKTTDGLLARGGLYQALVSLEYSYPVVENWRLATFYDTGTTTDDFSESLKSDVGVGVRWQTPVGPIRLDFAWGLQDDAHAAFDRPFRVSFSIGVNL